MTDTATPAEELATCAGCGAPIRWVITMGDKRMPLDPEPHEDGTVVPRKLPDGRVRAQVLTGENLPAQETAYRSHFVTCPKAPDFRRRKSLATRKCLGCGHPLDAVLADAGDTYHPTCAPLGLAEVFAQAREEAAAARAAETPEAHGQEALDL